MEADLAAWKAEKAKILQDRVALYKPATELRAQRDKYLADKIAEGSTETLAGIQNKLANFPIKIRQIHVKDVDLVDRCESCHLGTREPVVLTKAAMGGEEVFTSHPDKELLKIHDPDKFGCTPCHGGNGVATSSIVKAHGRHTFWLWPMHHPENVQAGCQQCHYKEVVTEMADTLNQGREIFRLRGCMGCHRYEGFDRDPEDLANIQKQIGQLEQQKAEWGREIGFTIQKADRSKDNKEAQKLYAHADDLKVRSSGLDAKIEQLDIRSQSLIREIKKVGPSLKEVRMKIRKEWLPVWLEDPHKWRPGTKMPTFRLDKDEIQAIAAFIWQSGVTGKLDTNPPGRSGEGQGSLRDARLHGLSLDGRGQSEGRRNVRRQPEPRRREGQLRLPGALDPQSAPAHAALLRFRKARPDRGRLQEEGRALRLRFRSHQVPQRRPRTAGPADDAHAESAPEHGRGAGHRQLPDDAQAGQCVLSRRPLSSTIRSSKPRASSW